MWDDYANARLIQGPGNAANVARHTLDRLDSFIAAVDGLTVAVVSTALPASATSFQPSTPVLYGHESQVYNSPKKGDLRT